MAFTSLQNEESFSEKNLICPITHKIFQDPVLAGDGHVYERTAIIQWIQANGTSPITLEPLSIDDLVTEQSIKQICQHQQMPVTYSTGNEEVTLSSLQSQWAPPTFAQSSIMATVQRLSGNKKHSGFICCICTLIVLAIIVFAVAIAFTVGSRRASGSRSYITAAAPFTTTSTPINDATTYILPNNCTLMQITTLLSLNNTAQFYYAFYSIPYTAVANQTMITFAFRQDPAYWIIDDISVREATSGTEVLQNGDFENAIFAPFSYCDQSGFNITPSTYSSDSRSHSGSYAFVDETAYAPDYISQMLSLTIGQVYNVTFWLLNGGGSPNSFMVMMSV